MSPMTPTLDDLLHRSRCDATVACVRDLLNADRRMRVQSSGDTLNTSKSVIHRIVTNEL